MKRKEKRTLMRKIVKLEEKLKLDKNNQSIQNQIQEIMSALSLEEILELDDYIMSKNVVDKNKNF